MYIGKTETLQLVGTRFRTPLCSHLYRLSLLLLHLVPRGCGVRRRPAASIVVRGAIGVVIVVAPVGVGVVVPAARARLAGAVVVALGVGARAGNGVGRAVRAARVGARTRVGVGVGVAAHDGGGREGRANIRERFRRFGFILVEFGFPIR
ncbi:hypothetical protein C8R44DRAFT_779705 [Mycena epipterygia]|nr:hypothetical protein C8R44DRAFT_779705 [Mycena epipterygia]